MGKLLGEVIFLFEGIHWEMLRGVEGKIPGQEKYPARGTIPWAMGEFTGKGEKFHFFGRTPRYYPLRRGFPQKYWENFQIYWAREKIYWGRC